MRANSLELKTALARPMSMERRLPGVNTLLRAGPGAKIGEHRHSKPFVTFLLSGVSDETDDRGRTQRIASGTLNYTPEGFLHAHHFLSDHCATLCAEFSSELINLASDRGSDLSRPQMIRSGAATNVAMRISTELLTGAQASSLVLQGLFIELLGEIIRAPQDRSAGAPAWLGLACSMLRDAPFESLSIQGVADEVSVHPAHLAKCFRKFVGQSPGEYARSARLERAYAEIHGTDKPLKLIAKESGFADAAHFSRSFKQAFGVIPSSIRRRVC